MDMSILNQGSYVLSEEVARWRFEVSVRNSSAWWIAFSNPTAGPWKRVEGYDEHHRRGEVHRFTREDRRPDLILVCDPASAVVIVEAKGKLSQLSRQPQIRRSADVIQALASVLQGKGRNPYWGSRANYAIVPGILWGTVTGSADEKFAQVASEWVGHLGTDALLGIAVVQDPAGDLRCVIRWHGTRIPELPAFE